MDELPEGVGPHEGRELDLMRLGQKDVAMFVGYEPDGLEAFLSEGGFASFTDTRNVGDFGYPVLFVYRDGYEAAARRLCDLTRNPPKGFQADHEHEVGRILGYTTFRWRPFLPMQGDRTPDICLKGVSWLSRTARRGYARAVGKDAIRMVQGQRSFRKLRNEAF